MCRPNLITIMTDQQQARLTAAAGIMKRLKELEEENRRLKRLIGELELDKAILRETLEGKDGARPGRGRPSSAPRRSWASPSAGHARCRVSRAPRSATAPAGRKTGRGW